MHLGKTHASNPSIRYLEKCNLLRFLKMVGECGLSVRALVNRPSLTTVSVYHSVTR